MGEGIKMCRMYNEAMDSSRQTVLPLAQQLTGREMEVLGLIGDGLTNREISEQMTVTISTVKWYVRQIYNKLGVSSRTEAIARARHLGLLLDLEQAHRQRLNLPPQHTSFIGRRREIADIRQLLMASRLITLTGPGGSGKTRLAAEVAAASARQFEDGAFFISLAAVSDPSQVRYTIAQELGIAELPGIPLLQSSGIQSGSYF